MDSIPQLGMLGYLGWPEITMMIVVVLILFGTRKLPGQWDRHRRSYDRSFQRAVQDFLDEFGKDPKNRHHPTYSADVKPSESNPNPASSVIRWLVVWLAQGFGIGRMPWAPGTFGSLLGLGWFAVLLVIAQWSPVSAGVVFLGSVLASVWTCEAAEIILGEKDPGSIVLDEIVALPTCFLGWMLLLWLQLGIVPSLQYFFGTTTWFVALGVFLAFRYFDIAKPWPVRQSQDLSRGWGVVMDDQLAAIYVNLVMVAVHFGLQWLR